MKETRYYEVAGHRFCVSSESDILALMDNYALSTADMDTVLFHAAFKTINESVQS